MALVAGARLGTFEIAAQIGKGGMGEVYRALDADLGRHVAIKILPEAFAHDPERLARFEREAKTLAALNHPNIAQVYGFEKADGIRALVMELVEGETLADRIAQGVIAIDEALPIARQIADALDAAHEKGVIHRDLKPANVKVTPNGTVKVLDFGLAKHVAMAAEDSQVETTVVRTQDGALVGTVGYMSPEQARGQAVDKRTDIWAFGCLLYELLTARRAFEGRTLTDTLAAIVHSEPDWSGLPANTPSRVERLLRRCLEKDPRRRLRDIGEVSAYLDEPSMGPREERGDTRVQPARDRRWRWIALPVVAIVLSALGAASLLWRADTPMPGGALSLGPSVPFTFDPGLTTDPSLSADGRLIAYASSRGDGRNLDIYVQQMTGGAAIRLTDDAANDDQPDVSPDGSLVAFHSDRHPAGIYVASTLGGTARLLAPEGRAPRFSPDGRFVAFETGTTLAPIAVTNTRNVFIVPSTGGAPIQLATNLVNAGGPTWAPDGTSLMVLGRKGRTGSDVALEWWRVPLEPNEPAVPTGAFEQLARSGIRLEAITVTIPYPRAWTKDGVFFSATTGGGDTLNLWHMSVDTTGRPTGAPVRLTQGTTLDTRFAVAGDGRVVWAARTSVQAHFGFPLDTAGLTTGQPRKLHDDSSPTGRSAISQDGRLLIFPRYNVASGILWAKDLRTGVERELVATPRTPLNPAISRDSHWVAYTLTAVQTGGNAGLGDGYVLETTGGVPRKMCDNCEAVAWTTDGQLVYDTGDRKTLGRISLQTGERHPLIDASTSVDRPLFGPNGTWMIFNMDDRIVHAPVHTDHATPESEWTTILTKMSPSERTAGLSPDGGLLYVLLEQDGFRCAYGLRLNRNTGLPQGKPFSGVHLHDAALVWSSTGYGSAVAAGVLVADIYESRGNIWMSQLIRGAPNPTP